MYLIFKFDSNKKNYEWILRCFLFEFLNIYFYSRKEENYLFIVVAFRVDFENFGKRRWIEYEWNWILFWERWVVSHETKKIESSISFYFLIILFYKMSIANKTPFSLHLFKEQQEKHSTGSDCLDMTGTFFFKNGGRKFKREKKKRKIERKNKFILHYFMLVKKQLLFNIFFFSLCENTIIIFYFSWY